MGQVKAIATVRRYAAVLVAVVAIVVFFALSRYPSLSSHESESLAAGFEFERHSLPEVPGPPHRHVRHVHPSLERISAWISSLGAAVALADLDGDGLPNDICYVETRTDQVIVAPVPGTGARYEPLVLRPEPLPFDSATMAPMGVLVGDFNEDGLLDLLVYYWGRTPVLFLRQKPPDLKMGTAVELSREAYVARELVDTGERWFTNAVTQADLDGDGHVDLIIGNYFQDGARILDAQATGREVMHAGKSRSFNGGRNRILLWQGATAGLEPTARFAEVDGGLGEEIDHAWTLALAAADLDGDLLPEVYYANDFGPDRLLHNRSRPGQLEFALLEGKRRWRDPKSCVLGFDSFKGMGADFGDVTGNGRLDIYVSNIATEFGLTESHFLWLHTGDNEVMKKGIAPYVHGAEFLGVSRSGWGWESRLADFNNSGVLEAIQAIGFLQGQVNRWPELQALGTSNDQIVHNPRFWPNFAPGADLSGQESNAFFTRAADGRYHDISSHLGLHEAMVSRGIATADVNGDGRLDFAIANQWKPSYFFYNWSPDVGRYLGLHLLLPVADLRTESVVARPGHPGPDLYGRPAIGAVARVKLPDGRELVNQVDGGSGHSGQRSPDLHFGLANTPEDARVEVRIRWRDIFGRPQETELSLRPGWHSVLLGSPLAEEESHSGGTRP